MEFHENYTIYMTIVLYMHVKLQRGVISYRKVIEKLLPFDCLHFMIFPSSVITLTAMDRVS